MKRVGLIGASTLAMACIGDYTPNTVYLSEQNLPTLPKSLTEHDVYCLEKAEQKRIRKFKTKGSK